MSFRFPSVLFRPGPRRRSAPPSARRSAWGTALAAGVAAAVARGLYTALTDRWGAGQARWNRVNYRGERVTLLEGPALAVGACAGAALAPTTRPALRGAAVLAGCGAAAFGAYDDLYGSGASRGFRGHLGALARGRVTTGAVKVAGIGASGLAAAAALTRDPVDVLVNGALIAGGANLLNLFDLRPGRAAKVALLAGAAALAHPGAAPVAAAALGATGALLPEDLRERAMLGDAGANALGALLGLAAATACPRRVRVGLLAGVAGLTAASEYVSFTRVIAVTPPLRRLDEWGCRPAPPRRAAEPAPVPQSG
ncbi:MAG TPA: hypothetical protein VKZ89_14910 [Thermobifida alba]|nr:hypothetical protein [Thermobifida alba]